MVWFPMLIAVQVMRMNQQQYLESQANLAKNSSSVDRRDLELVCPRRQSICQQIMSVIRDAGKSVDCRTVMEHGIICLYTPVKDSDRRKCLNAENEIQRNGILVLVEGCKLSGTDSI
jgi:hypothetical protein